MHDQRDLIVDQCVETAQDTPAAQSRLMRRAEVEASTGLSRSTLYEWMKRGEFPRPIKLGARLVAWRESDVTAWIKSREPRAG